MKMLNSKLKTWNLTTVTRINLFSHVLNIIFTIVLLGGAVDELIAVYVFGLPQRPAHYFLIRILSIALILAITKYLSNKSEDELKRRETNL